MYERRPIEQVFKELVKSDEGFSHTIYRCTKGKRTIGYGFNLEVGLTKEECDAVLAVKTKNLINDVSKRFPKFFTLSTNRQLALLNIAYNIGVSGLFEFVEMFKALRQNDYDKAAEEILDSKAARELPSRYWRISKLMMDG